MLLNPCPIIDIRKTVEDDTEQQKAMEDAVQILANNIQTIWSSTTAQFGIRGGAYSLALVENSGAIEE